MIHILNKLLSICVVFLFLSCSQDPLKHISPTLRTGVYETGSHNKSFLDSHFISRDILRLIHNNKKDFDLIFKAGQESGYVIQIQSLYEDFPYNIDVQIPSELLESLLKNFTWKYDKIKKELVIAWKPDEYFTGHEPEKNITLPVHLELTHIKHYDRTPFLVKRELHLTVEKSYQAPRITQFVYDSLIYRQLEDGYFYRHPSDGKINLRLNRTVYGRLYPASSGPYSYHSSPHSRSHARSQNKDNSYFTEPINLSHVNNLPLYDTQIINHTVETRTVLTTQVSKRLRRAIYIKKEGKDCVSNETKQNEIDKTVCYVELEDGGNKKIDLNLEIYEDYYVFPDTLTYQDEEGQNQTFTFDTKVDQVYLHKKLKDDTHCFNIANQRRYLSGSSGKAPCFVRAYPHDEFMPIDDLNIYYLPIMPLQPSEDMKKYRISFDQLQRKFRLIPNYLKLLIAGYQPLAVSDISGINLSFSSALNRRRKVLQIYVEDANYTKLGPSLSIFKKGDIFSFIKLDISQKLSHSSLDEGHIWSFMYNLTDTHSSLDKIIEPNSQLDFVQYFKNPIFDFQSFSPIFTPESGEDKEYIGSSIPFVFSIFPQVPVFHKRDIKDQVNNLEVNPVLQIETQADGTQVKKIDHTLLKWSEKFNINSLFPENTFNTVLKSLPLKPNLTHFQTPFKASQLLDVVHIDLQPYVKSRQFTDTSSATSIVCNQENAEDANANSKGVITSALCHCTPTYQKEKEESLMAHKLTLASECHVNLEMQVDSDQHTPFYVNYTYDIHYRFAFRKDIFDINTEINLNHYLMNDDGIHFIPSYNHRATIFDSHLFFNMKPMIQCLSVVDSENKECTIFYAYSTTSLDMEKPFFMDLSCKDSKGVDQPCPCEADVQVNRDWNQMYAFSKKCVFNKSDTGTIASSLRTESKNIYFINILKEQDKFNFRKTTTEYVSY